MLERHPGPYLAEFRRDVPLEIGPFGPKSLGAPRSAQVHLPAVEAPLKTINGRFENFPEFPP